MRSDTAATAASCCQRRTTPAQATGEARQLVVDGGDAGHVENRNVGHSLERPGFVAGGSEAGTS
eukprot:2262095-Pyramimonas_sp.AAC.1